MDGAARDMADERFAANLKAARERAGLSQRDLAERMTEGGHPMHQQTIARIEAGGRAVRVGEAWALARAVRTTLETLALPAGAALDAWRLTDGARRVREAARQVTGSAARLDSERRDLAALIGRLTAAGLAGQLAGEMAIARRAITETEEPGGAG